MGESFIELTNEFERLANNVEQKRKVLLWRAHQRLRVKKILNVISGILALFSAGAITAALLTVIGNNGLQILAAVTALFSGIISLVLVNLLNDVETAQMFAGASAFLSLREKLGQAQLSLKFNKMSNKNILALLDACKATYSDLDSQFGIYVVRQIKPGKFHGGQQY